MLPSEQLELRERGRKTERERARERKGGRGRWRGRERGTHMVEKAEADACALKIDGRELSNGKEIAIGD